MPTVPRQGSKAHMIDHVRTMDIQFQLSVFIANGIVTYHSVLV